MVFPGSNASENALYDCHNPDREHLSQISGRRDVGSYNAIFLQANLSGALTGVAFGQPGSRCFSCRRYLGGQSLQFQVRMKAKYRLHF